MHAAAASATPERDTELVAAVARGDRRAFEELYVSYRHRVARFVLRLAPRHEIAEEVVDDTFWVVWRKAKQFRGDARVSTWIMGIAYRRALKMLRDARADLPSAGGQPLESEPAADESGQVAEQRDWLAQGLRQLPRDQRTSLELAYYLGLSCEEIAQIMDCGVPAVKCRMLRGREKLRVSLPRLAGDMATVRRKPADSLIAALAVVTIGLSMWGAASWMQGRAKSWDAPYRTVTLPAAAEKGAVIHVVFARSFGLSERDALLERTGLKIVGGPTPEGVYSLAPASAMDPSAIASALHQLQAHPGVSFAQPVASARNE